MAEIPWHPRRLIASLFLCLFGVGLGIGFSAAPSHGYGKGQGAPPAHEQSAGELSVVGRESWISDHEARLSLAELLSYRPKTQPQAVKELQRLLDEQPTDRLELVRLADIAANTGHASTARTLYEKALALPDAPAELRIGYADRMAEWGDFHGAERIYRASLAKHPASPQISVKLAKLLASSERYEEAEGIYRGLLRSHPRSPELLAELARTKAQEKDFPAALELVRRAGDLSPTDPQLIELKASILLAQGRFADARAEYLLLAKQQDKKAEPLVGVARSYVEEAWSKSLSSGKLDSMPPKPVAAGAETPEAARVFADQALALRPDDVEARLYRDFQLLPADDYIRGLLSAYPSPSQLAKIGTFYVSHGYPDQGALFYQAALDRDPEFFPARLGSAETLAQLHRYDESIAAYRKLLQVFPGDAKLQIALARVLAWSRQYQAAIALYGEIRKDAPADPVPVKEQARTAVWGKRMDEAQSYYAALLSPPVDRQVSLGLQKIVQARAAGDAAALAKAVAEEFDPRAPYRGYETAAATLSRGEIADPQQRGALDKLLTEQFPAYRIQKGAALERDAKLLAWQTRFGRALDKYDELILFQPGNEEAIFDRAQASCALGLIAPANDDYRRLLAIDPLHGMAREALEQGSIRLRPALELGQSYWHEQGRGELSRISRWKSDLGVEIPVLDRYRISVAGNAWLESPRYGGRGYSAYGHTLGVDAVLNRYLSGSVSWTRKNYEDRSLATRDTGSASLSVNVYDLMRWELGYQRNDELYNVFGIRKGTQSDSYWSSLSGRPTRNLSLSARGGASVYNDDNAAQFAELAAGYALSDHPRTFKVIAEGAYRNVRHGNVYLFDNGGNLLDIVHPYWAPANYFAENLTLEWNHDLSDQLFCGGRRHYYDLKASVGTGTDHNQAVRFDAEWNYEFYRRWLLSLKGTLHRSRQWNADGGWLTLNYRF
jgi:Flp pilus assembly protein TadD